jgi:hypothetical protein
VWKELDAVTAPGKPAARALRRESSGWQDRLVNSFGDPLERLRSFFAAENARDWSKYAEFLHPDVEWFIFDTPGGRVVQGRSRYLDEIVQAYAGSSATFEAELTVVDPAAGRIAAVLVSSTARRSIDIFEFDDELIRREWEFYEPPSSS